MRPCFLVIDNEYPGSISTRKLVIESAKLNVITAYSAEEALQTMKRFPNVDGVVIDWNIHGIPCASLIPMLREIRQDVPIITISPTGLESCEGESYRVASFDPKQLLEQLQKLCPREIKDALREDEDLSREERG